MKPILNIAIIGEGKNDVGIMGKEVWEDGTIQEYLRRFLEDKFELIFHPFAVSKSETKNIKGLKGGRYRKYHIRGVAKKLFRFASLHRKSEDLDVLIFFSDTDKTQGKEASKKEAISKYNAVLKDIYEGQKLINDEMSYLDFIPMVPIRILECWLLGDYEGFNNIGCYPQNPPLPKTSELIWGDKNDPESDYPKHYLRRVLENGSYPNTTESYRLIVMNNNFEKLCECCDLSFLPFYTDMMRYREKLLLDL